MMEWLHSLNGSSTFFFYGFVIGAILTVLYVLLSDILGAAFDGAIPSGALNPTIILSFISIFCCSGFLMESKTSWGTSLIIILSFFVTFILVLLLHVFVIVPMSKAEQSTATSLKDLEGFVGKVTTSIPSDGMGQVVVTKNHQINNYSASSVNQTPIEAGTEVRIISIQTGNVLVVEPYQRSLKN